MNRDNRKNECTTKSCPILKKPEQGKCCAFSHCTYQNNNGILKDVSWMVIKNDKDVMSIHLSELEITPISKDLHRSALDPSLGYGYECIISGGEKSLFDQLSSLYYDEVTEVTLVYECGCAIVIRAELWTQKTSIDDIRLRIETNSPEARVGVVCMAEVEENEYRIKHAKVRCVEELNQTLNATRSLETAERILKTLENLH